MPATLSGGESPDEVVTAQREGDITMNRIRIHARTVLLLGCGVAVTVCGGSWFYTAAAQNRRSLSVQKSRPAARRTTTTGGSILATACRVKLLKQVALGFDRVGTIKQLNFREGDLVKAGQLVAQLSDDVARAALASAEKKAGNDVHKRYASKSYDVAKNEREQAELANKNTGMNVVPLIEVRRLLLAEERSRLQIEQADHDQLIAVLDRELAKADLNTYFLAAPFAGTITRRFKYAGEAVRQGDPVIELVSTATMKIEGRVPLRDVLRLKPGQVVTVKLIDSEEQPDELPAAFKAATFRGRLVFIDPGVNPVGERDVRVWAEVANQGGLLRHGLTAVMSIDPATRP
ncbi:MAG: hypothetical protein CMJ65_14935 [Planctomycetaceae bacterium]|nr:hypothetical protein [Planctomycetaceae bacterium]